MASATLDDAIANLPDSARPSISVWSLPNKTLQEIAEHGGIPNKWLRYCTARELRARGFTIKKTGGSGHYSILFERVPDEQTWEALRAVFSGWERNDSAL